jgi:hypothetical protein
MRYTSPGKVRSSRCYETLVDPDTNVDVNTGMIAAGRLPALIESREGAADVAEMMAELNMIIKAVKSAVPPPMP